MKHFKSTLGLAIVLFLARALYATEGVDQYPNGSESWQSAHLPPAGLHFVNYSFYYSGELKNASGAKVNLGGGTPTATAFADGLRAIWMSAKKPLKAEYGAYVVFAAVDQQVNLNGGRSTRGMADAAFSPLVLGWHTKNWHWATAMEFDAPMGRYDKNDTRVTLGTNYWSYQPIFGFTYLSKSGWEASGKFMYNINATNPDTHYKSGQDFHADYVAGKHVGHWALGVSGYFYKQLTDDTINGQIIAAVPYLFDAGRRGQVLAAGPSMKYESKNHVGFIVQWGHETMVRNRFGGDKLLLKMIVPTAWLRSPRF